MSDSTALATTGEVALRPRTFEDAERWAKKLSESSLVPKHFAGKPQDVFWAIAYGSDLGMSPTAALQAIYVVHGRPGLYADAMVALVLSSGRCDYFRCVESNASAAMFETRRKGAAEPVRKRVTMEMARAAGWTSNAKYKSEPDRMLEARAKSWLARLVYPDVLAGVQAVEELETIDMVEASPGVYSAPPPPSASTDAKVVDAEALDEADGSDIDREAAEIEELFLAGELGPEVMARAEKIPKGSPQRKHLESIYREALTRLQRKDEAP